MIPPLLLSGLRPGASVAIAIAASLLAIAHLVVVQRLPEPAADPLDAFPKPAYSGLVTPPWIIGLAVLAAGLSLLASRIQPDAWPMWLTYAAGVGVLVWVDGRTTYLPRSLTRLCWVEMLIALAITLSVRPPGDSSALAVHVLAGGLAATVLLGLVWRFTGGLGFGDVRLAPMVGGMAALGGLQGWLLGMLLGTSAGALAGLATSVWRRRRPSALGGSFAYGPALWAGPWLALVLLWR